MSSKQVNDDEILILFNDVLSDLKNKGKKFDKKAFDKALKERIGSNNALKIEVIKSDNPIRLNEKYKNLRRDLLKRHFEQEDERKKREERLKYAKLAAEEAKKALEMANKEFNEARARNSSIENTPQVIATDIPRDEQVYSSGIKEAVQMGIKEQNRHKKGFEGVARLKGLFPPGSHGGRKTKKQRRKRRRKTRRKIKKRTKRRKRVKNVRKTRRRLNQRKIQIGCKRKY